MMWKILLAGATFIAGSALIYKYWTLDGGLVFLGFIVVASAIPLIAKVANPR